MWCNSNILMPYILLYSQRMIIFNRRELLLVDLIVDKDTSHEIWCNALEFNEYCLVYIRMLFSILRAASDTLPTAVNLKHRTLVHSVWCKVYTVPGSSAYHSPCFGWLSYSTVTPNCWRSLLYHVLFHCMLTHGGCGWVTVPGVQFPLTCLLPRTIQT